MEVRKIRGVKTLEKLCPYNFTPNGIAVYPQEQVFTE
jgi:hypothetical protein